MIKDNNQVYDGYKIRMSLGKWYLLLFAGNVNSGKRFGPFSYTEAMNVVKEHELIDVERGLVIGDRP